MRCHNLKVHVQGALNMDGLKLEIKETIMQMAIYAGFPAMLNAMFAAQEVFDQQSTKDTQAHSHLDH